MKAKEAHEQYSKAETKRRVEAALRGARNVGHKPRKDIRPKKGDDKDDASSSNE